MFISTIGCPWLSRRVQEYLCIWDEGKRAWGWAVFFFFFVHFSDWQAWKARKGYTCVLRVSSSSCQTSPLQRLRHLRKFRRWWWSTAPKQKNLIWQIRCQGFIHHVGSFWAATLRGCVHGVSGREGFLFVFHCLKTRRFIFFPPDCCRYCMK